MSVTLTTVDPVLRVADICRLFKISESQFYELRESFFQAHGLLVEIVPRMDRCPRYAGAPIAQFLSDKHQQRLFRAQMKELAS